MIAAAALAALAACGASTASGESRTHAANAAVTPLDGLWKQAAVTCADGHVPADPVRELDFGDDHAFSVTFAPFETYKDYWGKVRFDLDTGEIAFAPAGGNHLPPDLKLTGRVRLDGGALRISGVWFGDHSDKGTGPLGCDYTFVRMGANLG
jgi:hypothetical protein